MSSTQPFQVVESFGVGGLEASGVDEELMHGEFAANVAVVASLGFGQ